MPCHLPAPALVGEDTLLALVHWWIRAFTIGS
jgi:hypothetical protein